MRDRFSNRLISACSSRQHCLANTPGPTVLLEKTPLHRVFSIRPDVTSEDAAKISTLQTQIFFLFCLVGETARIVPLV